MTAKRRRLVRLLVALNEMPQPSYPRVWYWAVGTGLALAALGLAIRGRHAIVVLEIYCPMWTLVNGTLSSLLLWNQRRARARTERQDGQNALSAYQDRGMPPQ